MNFKDRLREEMEFKGMLAKEIAAAVGISGSTFLSYIDARGVLPNVETAVKIAKVLGVSVEYLVTGEDSTPNSERYKEVRAIVSDLLKMNDSELAMLKKMTAALVAC